MSRVHWGEDDKKIYEYGIDRGVLYLEGQQGVVWDGLTTVSDDSERSSTTFFFDGRKYTNQETVEAYKGQIKAITYPDEFAEHSGYEELASGLYLPNQDKRPFGITFRTLVGDVSVGPELGYKIHILYNLSANPASIGYESADGNVDPIVFEWSLSSRPVTLPGYSPTAYAIADSRYLDPEILDHLENILYGTDTIDSYLPSLGSLIVLLENNWTIIITDHGDGTWSAEGPDEMIIAMDEGDFTILGSNAVYLDEYTYTVSSS